MNAAQAACWLKSAWWSLSASGSKAAPPGKVLFSGHFWFYANVAFAAATAAADFLQLRQTVRNEAGQPHFISVDEPQYFFL